MKNAHAQQVRRIDALMDHASRDLVAMKYFDAETACLQALDRAYAIRDYERMARILLPLEECRRQKRDLAFDSGAVHVVAGQLPSTAKMAPGLYLVCPPRVGVDGRELRERADKKKIPTIVVVREPTSRDGLWPVVSIGPVTVRTKVTPPLPPAAALPTPAAGSTKPARTAKKAKTVAAPAAAPPPAAAPSLPSGEPVPSPSWFLRANEAIGDAALTQTTDELRAGIRVDLLMARLSAHPDHEKLHQALAQACRDAMREPAPVANTGAGPLAGVENGVGLDDGTHDMPRAGGNADAGPVGGDAAGVTSSYRGRGARSGHR